MKIKVSKMDENSMDEYEIKECAETLIKAEEIKKDAKKMAKVKEYLKSKKAAINSIDDLRKKGQEVAMKEMEDGDDS